MKFRANSFTDKGPGLQYFGIGSEKGIDPAIRSKKTHKTIRGNCNSCFSSGWTDAVVFENPEKEVFKYGTGTDLTSATEFSEITICVRFKFTIFLDTQ